MTTGNLGTTSAPPAGTLKAKAEKWFVFKKKDEDFVVFDTIFTVPGMKWLDVQKIAESKHQRFDLYVLHEKDYLTCQQ